MVCGVCRLHKLCLYLGLRGRSLLTVFFLPAQLSKNLQTVDVTVLFLERPKLNLNELAFVGMSLCMV